MAESATSSTHVPIPAPRDVVELLKPITWFPPMWAFMCGVVSSGASLDGRWIFLIAGIALTGPLVCGTSQAVKLATSCQGNDRGEEKREETALWSS